MAYVTEPAYDIYAIAEINQYGGIVKIEQHGGSSTRVTPMAYATLASARRGLARQYNPYLKNLKIIKMMDFEVIE